MSEPEKLDKKTINSFKQNKRRLIVGDLLDRLAPESGRPIPEADFKVLIEETLLRRGVNKWMNNRKRIIRLKHEMRRKIPGIQVAMALARDNRDWYRRGYYRGYLRALTEARNAIREICQSERWVEKF